MFAHFRNRPEPDLDRQPLALEHLRDMGRGVPKSVLSHDAYGALLTVGATRRVIVDAYTHTGREWVIEVHGAFPWQECRWTPAQWQTFYTRHLATLYWNGDLTGDAWVRLCAEIARQYPNGQLASTVDCAEVSA